MTLVSEQSSQSAQDAVDKTLGGRPAKPGGQLDRFVQGGVSRHLVQKSQLECAKVEDLAQPGLDVVQRTSEQWSQQGIQRALPPERTVHKLRRQPAIGRRELHFPKPALERLLDERTSGRGGQTIEHDLQSKTASALVDFPGENRRGFHFVSRPGRRPNALMRLVEESWWAAGLLTRLTRAKLSRLVHSIDISIILHVSMQLDRRACILIPCGGYSLLHHLGRHP